MDNRTGEIFRFKDLEELENAKKKNPNLIELANEPKKDCLICHGKGSMRLAGNGIYLPCVCCRKEERKVE